MHRNSSSSRSMMVSNRSKNKNKSNNIYAPMNRRYTNHDYELPSMRRGRSRRTALQERLQDIHLFELTDDRCVIVIVIHSAICFVVNDAFLWTQGVQGWMDA